jgi:hypothetical protein
VTASLLVLFVLFMVAILVANEGHFAYTLDAPYTHLTLAEQIRHGTYGLNAGEPAAPSSTILFPLLLVPLLGLGQYGPALLCLLALALFAGYTIRNVEDLQSSRTTYAGSLQIRRFVADDCRCAVATTRPGIIKFCNPYYMLDLSGLASVAVQRALISHATSNIGWMDDLVRSHGISLAILYLDTGTSPPAAWTPLAELRTTDRSLATRGSIATFYAVRCGRTMPPASSPACTASDTACREARTTGPCS